MRAPPISPRNVTPTGNSFAGLTSGEDESDEEDEVPAEGASGAGSDQGEAVKPTEDCRGNGETDAPEGSAADERPQRSAKKKKRRRRKAQASTDSQEEESREGAETQEDDEDKSVEEASGAEKPEAA